MKICRTPPDRMLGIIGVACSAISVNQPEFLPIGLALMAMAAVRQWRVCRRSKRILPGTPQ